MDQISFEFFQWKTVAGVRPWLQLAAIVALYVLTTIVAWVEWRTKGTMFGYPVSVSLLFVPVYEEALFRGIILQFLEKKLHANKAIVVTSFLFGLWHLKNIFFLPIPQLFSQVIYTGLIFSPIVCLLTLKTRTIWPAVTVHYLHNLAVPLITLAAAL